MAYVDESSRKAILERGFLVALVLLAIYLAVRDKLKPTPESGKVLKPTPESGKVMCDGIEKWIWEVDWWCYRCGATRIDKRCPACGLSAPVGHGKDPDPA